MTKDNAVTVKKTAELISECICGETLKKLVLSKPYDDGILKTEGRLVKIKGKVNLQLETFTSDGKALHNNIPSSDVIKMLEGIITRYGQVNIITVSGDAELITSKKGVSTLINKIKRTEASFAVPDHDKEKKQNILYDGTVYPFLVKLGVTDENGRVFDKKRAKFRQIDRFLQYVDEIYPKLPKSGDLYILDLCCGKSYLTFAVYWFLTEKQGRTVKMTGVDLKKDVIEYCSEVSTDLGYGGLEFICGDILKFEPVRSPDMVLSLHACDIATDIVLTTAARLGAGVILSTPCCQHQVMNELSKESKIGSALLPIMEHSLLKQKLAVAITDALRCKRLQASGYSVNVTELIDPEDTPKNLMIRAYKIKMSEEEKKKYKTEFEAMSSFCSVDIFPGKDLVR